MANDAGRELLILGMLRRQPMSAYELSRAVHRHAPLYRAFKSGNIYHTVKRFAERGLLVSRAAGSQRGPAETKAIFALSHDGERYFRALFERTLADVQAPDPTMEVAYVLLGQLPRTRARALLLERDRETAAQERRLSRVFGDRAGRTGASAFALSHASARLRYERAFLRECIALLDDGGWAPDWTDDEAIVPTQAEEMQD